MTDLCSIRDCPRIGNEPGGGRGLCSKHYARLQRGQPLSGESRYEKPVEQRFWEKVKKTDSCWLWTGAQNKKGYGQFRVSPSANTPRKAHRWAWESLVGPIPTGLEIDHVVCAVTNCVRPDHMEIVTKSENVRRARALRPRPTHCKRGHAFTTENTRINAKGAMNCRQCAHDQYLARRTSA